MTVYSSEVTRRNWCYSLRLFYLKKSKQKQTNKKIKTGISGEKKRFFFLRRWFLHAYAYSVRQAFKKWSVSRHYFCKNVVWIFKEFKLRDTSYCIHVLKSFRFSWKLNLVKRINQPLKILALPRKCHKTHFSERCCKALPFWSLKQWIFKQNVFQLKSRWKYKTNIWLL